MTCFCECQILYIGIFVCTVAIQVTDHEVVILWLNKFTLTGKHQNYPCCYSFSKNTPNKMFILTKGETRSPYGRSYSEMPLIVA